MEYRYKGVNEDGKVVKGSIFHENQRSALNELSSKGIYCIWCKGEKDSEDEDLRSKIPYRDLVFLCRTLKNNMRSGIPIITSLRMAANHIKRKKLTITLKKLIVFIEGGDTLTGALMKCGGLFSEIFISMVNLGEKSGNLEEIFSRLEVYFKREEKRRKNIINILIYPMIIFTVASLGAFILITKFMPNFFNNMKIDKNDLPFITKFYMATAEVLTKADYFIIPLVLISILLMSFYLKRIIQWSYVDKLKYTSPLIRDINIKNFCCRFTMALQMIISSGIDIKGAFLLLEDSEPSIFLKEKYSKAVEDLEKGYVLSEVIRNFELFPEEFLVSIYLGEESGNLEGTLQIFNDIFEEELKNKLDLFIKLLEPALILLAGLFLLSIYIAVLMPIYSMYSR